MGDDRVSFFLNRQFVFPQIEKKKIKIFIDSIYKLDDVVKAHKRLDEGKHIGKIVLNI